MNLNTWLDKHNIYLHYIDENTIYIKDTGDKFLRELWQLNDYYVSSLIAGLIILIKKS